MNPPLPLINHGGPNIAGIPGVTSPTANPIGGPVAITSSEHTASENTTKPVSTNEPGGGWESRIETLLNRWIVQIDKIAKDHLTRGDKCRLMYIIFGFSTILFQSGSLVTLINNIASTAINQKYNTTSTDPQIQIQLQQENLAAQDNLIYAITAISIIVLLIQGLNQFFNWSTGAAAHMTASNEYSSLSRFISVTLTLKRNDRDSAKDFLNSVQSQFNDITKTAPALPDSINLDSTPPEEKTINMTGEETVIPNASKNKFMAEYQKQKLVNLKENKSGLLGNFQYQWQRYEEADADVVADDKSHGESQIPPK